MRIAKLKLTATIAAAVIGLTGMVVGISASPRSDDTPAKKEAPAVAKKVEQPAEKLLIADAKQRVHSENQLRQILLACHNYESVNQHFPADVVDRKGKPLLSWRVVILPYIEQEHVFQQFKLDEPWDSEHNKKAAEIGVKLFTNGLEPKNTKYPVTFFQRPTGKGTIHEPGMNTKIASVRDGLSNTLFIVETNQAVEWAKPDDLKFDPMKPSELRGPFANVIHCGFGDGSTRTFSGGVSADAARKFITRDRGELFPPEEYKGIGFTASKELNPEQEKNKLLNEIDDQMSLLKKLYDENLKLYEELSKLQTERLKIEQAERLKTAGNLGLAQQLKDLEHRIKEEKDYRQHLSEQIRSEKNPN